MWVPLKTRRNRRSEQHYPGADAAERQPPARQDASPVAHAEPRDSDDQPAHDRKRHEADR
jgi:hypothetical protein